MSIRTLVSSVAACSLLMLVQLLGTLAGPPWGWLCALAIGVGGVFLLEFFEVRLVHWWAPVMPVLAASFLGTAVSLGVATDSNVWLAPVLSAAASLVVVFTRKIASKQCELCKRRLAGSIAFACPRCGLLVCEQKCWIFEGLRCRLCSENKVPIFSAEERWWREQLGPRVRNGKCQLCLSDAAEADLRACKKCGRAQCRDCWDFANGQCSRCRWIVADLPPALQGYMLPKGAAEITAPRRA